MNIPKQFKMLGQTIKVTRDPDEFTNVTDSNGSANYRKNIINIRPDLPTYPMPQEISEQAFWHEFTHFLLDRCQASRHQEKHEDMCNDEGFVEMISHVLHQAINTFEY